MPPDEPTDEERQEQLPEDNETPFRPAAPTADPAAGTKDDPLTQAASDNSIDDTHPVADTNQQPEEQYDEGIAGAAEAETPNTASQVAGYDPPAEAGTGENDTQDRPGEEPVSGSDSGNMVVG